MIESDGRALASDVLLPVNPRHSFINVVEVLFGALEDDEMGELVVDSFGSVGDWLTDEDQPFVDAEHMAEWDRSRRWDGDLGLIEGPAFLEPIVVALYLSAKAGLARSAGREFFRDLEGSLENIERDLNNLPSDFIGELLIETERRASRDRGFAKALQTGADEIKELRPYLESLEEQASALKDNDWFDEDDCACHVTATNAHGHTQNFCIESWWDCVLIALGIILVIIAVVAA